MGGGLGILLQFATCVWGVESQSCGMGLRHTRTHLVTGTVLRVLPTVYLSVQTILAR